MLTNVRGDEPLDPPYPPAENMLQGWGYLGIVAWVAGGFCAYFGFYWGCALLAPGLVWFIHGQRRAGALCRRAVVGLERRASRMSSTDREQNIAEIETLYGGRVNAGIQRRFKAIRALPSASPQDEADAT